MEKKSWIRLHFKFFCEFYIFRPRKIIPLISFFFHLSHLIISEFIYSRFAFCFPNVVFGNERMHFIFLCKFCFVECYMAFVVFSCFRKFSSFAYSFSLSSLSDFRSPHSHGHCVEKPTVKAQKLANPKYTSSNQQQSSTRIQDMTRWQSWNISRSGWGESLLIER